MRSVSCEKDSGIEWRKNPGNRLVEQYEANKAKDEELQTLRSVRQSKADEIGRSCSPCMKWIPPPRSLPLSSD